MHNETLREENKRLRKHLYNLFDEEKIIKAIVEAICGHEISSDVFADKGDIGGSASETDEAGALLNALEERGITLEEDKKDSEIIHVMHGNERCFTFSTAEWQWQNADGTWPWETTENTYTITHTANPE